MWTSASDKRAVTKVEFYDGASLIGTDTTSPYSMEWNTLSVPKGSHTLTPGPTTRRGM